MSEPLGWHEMDGLDVLEIVVAISDHRAHLTHQASIAIARADLDQMTPECIATHFTAPAIASIQNRIKEGV